MDNRFDRASPNLAQPSNPTASPAPPPPSSTAAGPSSAGTPAAAAATTSASPQTSTVANAASKEPTPGPAAAGAGATPSPATGTPAPGATAAAAPASAAAAPSAASAAAQQNYRPLNVRDALSYLDQVKVQFHDQPDVYNRFLDVMKEFKGQVIDTPGVIDRVSSLFRGHPTLIQGFNTFLPPGYRIECLGGEGDERGLITVITPSGTVSQIAGQFSAGLAALPASNAAAAAAAAAQSQGAAGHAEQPGATPAGGAASGGQASSAQPLAQHAAGSHLHAPSPAPTTGGHPSQPPAAAGGAHAHPQAQQAAARPSLFGPDVRGSPQVEFNHAINYVNKIKNRFSNDPETYKQFLEILQTYQKEQRPIQDVYAQVTILFKNAPDLLDEFKQFLPDTSNGAPAPQGNLFGGLIGQMTGIPQQGAGTAGPPDAGQTAASAAASGSRDKQKQVRSEKKDRENKKDAAAAAAAASSAGSDKQKKRPLGAEKEAVKQGSSKPKKIKHTHKDATPPPEDFAVQEPAYTAPANPNGNLACPDEIAFFERVKKYIENKDTYHEFLKLLNLFVQDIIDSKVLVERAYLFIGQSGDIWNQFRGLIGDDQAGRGGIQGVGGQYGLNGSGGILGAGAGLDGVLENTLSVDRPRVDLNSCKAYGASYRKLPKEEVNLSCSGRDPMCWDVLNDEWVSHPTSASEDAVPFIAHRKNIYEDALHRAEEERHEYDYHIEANLRTIALLEPIAARINVMTPDEKSTFRLKPGLGGQSKSIYQRIIKKIYGRDPGLEVIAALHDNPTVAVPVVLARLKQKDEEWKRAQREWNKVWREVDAKSFYKSLDHQGVTFKANDKKAITSKSLVAEIEALRREQAQRRDAVNEPSLSAKPKYQYAFKIDDMDCLQDSLKLVFSYLDRAPGGISMTDRERVESFLRMLLPTFLMYPHADFDAAFALPTDGANEDGDNESETDGLSDGTSGFGDDDESTASRKGKKSASDLRRKVLKAAGGPPKKNGSAAPEAAASPANANGEESAATPASNDGEATAMETDGAPAAPAAADALAPDAPAAGDKEDVEMAAGESKQAVASSSAPVAEKTWIATAADEPAKADDRLSRASSPALSSYGGDGARRPTKKGNFFTNTPIYCLFRLVQMLYNRISTLKEIGRQQAEATPPVTLVNPLAEQLGLNDVGGPSPLLMAGGNPSSHFYEHTMHLCESLFDNEIDQYNFEENMRHMYGTKAYVSFTLDKLVAAIVKQVQTILGDSKSQELLALLAADRATEVSTARQQISYRMNAESVVGSDESLFRLEWVDETKTMLVQLLGKDDLTIDDAITAEQKWKAYVASYITGHPTEGLPAKVEAPLLRRTVQPWTVRPPPSAFIAESGLEMKVCIGSFKLFFVPETADYYLNRKTVADEEKAKARGVERRKANKEKMDKWVESKLASMDAPAAAAAGAALTLA